MSLLVETGTGSATSESFCSVADADTRHSNFGNTSWAVLSTAVKEQSLRKATAYMQQMYRPQWKGVRHSATQALDFPRDLVYLEPFYMGGIGSYPFLLANNVVPTEVVGACADLALKASTGELLPDETQSIKMERIGPVSVEYNPFSPQQVRYTAIDAILSPYLKTNGVSHSLTK